ncbi:MAG TPA: hypothetical protein VJV04_15685 [Nitrospiraceae bacterium]|nr:hypothetical protein [Nitrospiraceae bacterium]
MKHTRLRTSPTPILLSCILTMAIFVLDLYAPAPLATAMLYVAPVALIAMWSPPNHYSLVVMMAIACTILTVGRLTYFSLDTIAWFTATNHGLAVCALWAIVLLSLLRKRMEQRAQWIDVLPRL